MAYLWILCCLMAIGLTGLGLSFAGGSAKEKNPVRLEHDPEAGTVRVLVRGEHLTTYHYGEAARTPFLWPVLGEGGVGLTRNFPMGEDEPRSVDHPHHRSIFLTFGNVNGSDFWHRERIVTRAVETGSTDDYAWIRADHQWLAADDTELLRERREIRFYDGPASGRWFDIITTFTASSGDATFRDNKEGMIAFRIRPEIQGNRAGVLTNDQGEQGERNVYGRPSKWIDYSGPIAGHGHRGIALFDHPSNFRHPGAWHVRNYGLAALNPFGHRSVAGRRDMPDHTLKKGDSITFVYRFFIHSGDVEQDEVARHYEAFARIEYDR